jgi:hypothetical protein
LLLRLLGPLLVFASLGVLGSGLGLIAIGQQASEQPWFFALGQDVSPVTVHQGFFVLFAVLVSLHVLARAMPALLLAVGRRRREAARVVVPGGIARAGAIFATLAAAIVAVVLVVPSVHGWHDQRFEHGVGHFRGR